MNNGQSSMDFHTVTIRQRATGTTFPHTCYTPTSEEAAAFARLTFSSAIYDVEIPGDAAASPHLPTGGADLPVRPNQPPTGSQMELL